MKNLFAGALLAALFLLMVWMALTVPVVEWSWTTGTCVSVEPASAGSCDNLPERYERAWVR